MKPTNKSNPRGYGLKVMLMCFAAMVGFDGIAQNTAINDPLVTDRPDQTEASSTVGKGTLQIETGGFYEAFEENNIKNENFTLNTTLIRYGILDNLELRLGWDFVEGITRVNGERQENITSGFSPLLLGVKIGIAEEQGLMPEIALIGHVFPIFSASTDYRPETTGIDFRFSLAHTLSERSSIGYNIGAAWGNDSPEATAIYTLAYGYSISNALGAYLEVYGDFPEDSRANHLWNAGCTYLLSNNVQLDATVGTSITEGQDLLLSAGISIRIPTKQESSNN